MGDRSRSPLSTLVSYTEFFNQLSYGSTPLNGIYKPNYLYHDQATYYNYDIHGNVDTLLHYYPTGAMASFGNNQFKKIAYNYDLVSGKVNVVSYQPGKQDGFCHRYEYDAENRIRDVYTSTNKAFIGDKNVEDHESASSYYKHGPLARTVIGQNQVQGLDYMYTLQGWLKGVNSPALQPSFDPGGDGNGLTVMPARDAFAFSLGYYIGDYKPINTTVNPIAEAGGYLGSDANKQLFNGNISNMAVGMSGVETQLSAYRYDQLNRLVAMDVYKKLKRPENSWSDIIPANRYAERIAYDGNGNILTYRRDGVETAPAMDQLQYHYTAGTNRLEYIHDDVVSAYTEDIESQAAGNYSYDSIGNLIRDVKEKIQDIQWTVYGKIRQITKDDGTIIQYTYDASGNRISKAVTMAGVTKVTWYVRDAQGNTMAMYALTDASIRLTEQYLYGSSRLGIARKNVTLFNSGAIPATNVSGLGNTYSETLTRGNKLYELSNHLGNVLVTVSDKKLGSLVTGSSSLIDHYEADIRNVQDYYPFGMLMGGRTSTARFCHEEVQDLTTLVVESNLNSGTTTSGNTITQSGIVWKSFNGSSADIHLVSQAAKLEAAASNNGLLIDFAAATFLPNTTYELSFDVPDKSAGVVTLGCTIQNNGDQPVRVAGNKTGTGRQSLIFTTPATIPTSWLLRISSLQYGTGWYFVVDNFMIRKYNAAAETPIYIETFDNAVMNGANIESNGHLWKPKFATGSPVSLAGTSGALKAKVTCTTVNESYLETEVDVTGGKSYLMKFSLAQDLSKRILLSIYYRTGSTWTIMETGGASYKGNGDYRLNFTIPTGASAVRASFSRYSGTVDDAPDLPYTIDNFGIIRLDTMSSQMINVCEDDGLDENGKKEGSYRYGFNGKENDNEVKGEGNQLDFDDRIYDPRIGKWLSTDPLQRNYPSESPYNFSLNSPLAFKDDDGRDAILITFPDYKIDPELKIWKWKVPKIPGLGHAGVLIINNKTGEGTYYEYGRYPTKDGTKGKVRKYNVGKIEFDKDGKAVVASLNAALKNISGISGQGGAIKGAYVISDKFEEMKAKADQKYKESNPGNKDYNKNRPPYILTENNCGTFAADIINQDPNVDRPGISNPSPLNIVSEYIDEGNAAVLYDPKANSTTVGEGDESDAKIDGGKSVPQNNTKPETVDKAKSKKSNSKTKKKN